jgi:hypothetical protein
MFTQLSFTWGFVMGALQYALRLEKARAQGRKTFPALIAANELMDAYGPMWRSIDAGQVWACDQAYEERPLTLEAALEEAGARGGLRLSNREIGLICQMADNKPKDPLTLGGTRLARTLANLTL